MTQPAPKPCHVVPAFGCSSCITNDRAAFANKAYAEWKKTFKLPKCPSCGKAMIHYEMIYDSRGVGATIICSGFDEEGVPTCDDQDCEIVIV